MKKLFASLMAATMVAGMSVSAFAYTDASKKDPMTEGSGSVAIAKEYKDSEDDYAFGKVILKGKKDVNTVNGGDKLYAPILVNVKEVEDDDAPAALAKGYFYATKASEVKDLKASVKETEGKGSIKSVEIVKDDAEKFGVQKAAGKIYGIKIVLNDYFKDEKDMEFDLTLKNKGSEMLKVEDILFRLGKDDDNSATKSEGKKEADEFGFGYDAKFKKSSQRLEFTVGKNTKLVTLDEISDKHDAKFNLTSKDNHDIKEIYMETADGEMIVEGKVSDQDALFLEFKTEATDFQKDVMVENSDAEVDTFVWSAHPTFDFIMDVRVPVEDDRDNFLYEVIDGKLVEVKTELSEDGDELTFETKTLGEYLLSDKQLTAEKAEAAVAEKGEAKEEAAKEDGVKENSETGAAIAVATVIALF